MDKLQSLNDYVALVSEEKQDEFMKWTKKAIHQVKETGKSGMVGVFYTIKPDPDSGALIITPDIVKTIPEEKQVQPIKVWLTPEGEVTTTDPTQTEFEFSVSGNDGLEDDLNEVLTEEEKEEERATYIKREYKGNWRTKRKGETK